MCLHGSNRCTEPHKSAALLPEVFFLFCLVLDEKHCVVEKKKIKKTPEGKRNATRKDENWVPLVNRGDDLTQSACIELHTAS